MQRVLTPLVLSLGLTPSALAEPPASTSYRLSPAHSDLYVVLRNDTGAMMSGLGHDHVIYASAFQGAVTWPATPGGPCTIHIEVPVQGLVVDPPGLRERAGLDDNTISESDKAKLSRNMWSRGQLDASTHPAVSFVAEACPGGTGKVPVEGTLTIRGVSRKVTVTMDVAADPAAFSARGRLETSHTDFGFKPFSATAFGPRNQDRLTLVVAVRGSARPEE